MSSSAWAMITIDGNAFYYSDNFKESTSSKYARVLWDGSLNLALTKKGQAMVGWEYNSAAFTDTDDTTTTTVTATGMGPKLTFYLDRDLIWSVAFAYDLILKANYSTTSGTPSKLEGTAMKAEIGCTPMVTESMYLGVKVNYYAANFSREITNGTTLKDVSYGRTNIYPSISIGFRLD